MYSTMHRKTAVIGRMSCRQSSRQPAQLTIGIDCYVLFDLPEPEKDQEK